MEDLYARISVVLILGSFTACFVKLRRTPTIAKFFMSLLLFQCCCCHAQELPILLLNVSTQGTTEGAPIDIYDSFENLNLPKNENEPKMGSGGQLLYSLSVPESSGKTHLRLSTCFGSEYHTYLAFFDKNPGEDNSTKILASSSNDFKCMKNPNRAFLSITVEPGSYFVIVTGNSNEAGAFNLSVSAIPATPAPLPWGLDRVDQRQLPLDNKFSVESSASGIRIYLIDSGVRATHSEFEDRVVHGYDFVLNKKNTTDCTGHGTHAAAIMMGKTYGIAKKAILVSLRVFDCNYTAVTSSILGAISWAAIDAQEHGTENTIIAMMFSIDEAMSRSLKGTIKYLKGLGITVINPSGDNGRNACDYYPGSSDDFLTVGATDQDDRRSSFSNFGPCNSLYAPGTDIPSAWHTSDTSWRTFSGTRQAAAHVTGIMAQLITLNEGINRTKANKIITSISTPDVITNIPANETARLSYVRSVPPFKGDAPPTKSVYLFTVLSFTGESSCETAKPKFKAVQVYFHELLSVSKDNVNVSCPFQSISTGSSRWKSSMRRDMRSTDLSAEFRILVLERRATGDYRLMQEALKGGKQKTENDVGFPFSVVYEPWVVDSTRRVFWGEPSFAEFATNGLSGGQIAGILVGCFCLFTVIATTAWLIHRTATGADEVESLEGSADYDKGPVHFNDVENNDGNNHSVMRSFRNVVRSMSFRRAGSQMGGGDDSGINRMASYIGSPKANVAKDMVRMESYGPEAFAGVTTTSTRNLSMILGLDKKEQSVPRGASFRGQNNLVLNHENDTAQSPSSNGPGMAPNVEDMRMRSMGGEAFALIGDRLASVRAASYSPQAAPVRTDTASTQDVRTESYGAEVLAADMSTNMEQSFFGGKQTGSLL